MNKTLRFSLLSMLMMLCGSIYADEVKFDFSTDDAYTLFGLTGFSSGTGDSYVSDGDITEDKSAKSGDVTVTVSPSGGKNPNRMWSGSLRMYGGTMTVASAGKNITAITFELNSGKWGSGNTADSGTLETGKWTGNAAKVVINVAANTQIKTMTVTLGEGGDTPPTPSGRTYNKVTAITSGKAYLIVADNDGLKAAQPVASTATFAYLKTSDVTDNDGVITMENSKQDFVITASGSNYTIKQADGRLFRNDPAYKTISVDETIETTEWTITANSDGTFKIMNATTNKWIQLDPGYGTYGCYDVEQGVMPYLYEYDGDPDPGPGPGPTPDIENVTNIAAFKALATGTEANLTLKDAEVLYVNGTNDIYVRDASGAIDFFKTGLTYTAGQKLNGSVIGIYDTYKNTPELTKSNNTNDSKITATSGTVTAKSIQPADAANYICDLVKFSGVTVTENEGKYYVGDVQVYDKFKVVKGTPDADKTYDIEGILIYYDNVVELCPTSDYTSGEVLPEETKDATIAEFNAAAESTNVWYKLKGEVKNLKDDDQYGNFDLEDATGSVYVYGLLSEKGGEKGKFQALAAEKGIKNGCKITIIGNRGSYKDKIEVLNAYFVSVDEAAPAELVIKGQETFDDFTLVTIIPSDVDHDVYYTTDGTDPKTSDTHIRYMLPFTIKESCTVKAWEEDADLYAEMTFTKTAAEELTVEDVIAAAPEETNAAPNQAKVWVTGYIVGFVEGQALATGAKFTADGCETNTNLLLATSADETDVEKCIPVQLPKGDIRTALNLQDNPSNLGKEVKLYGHVLKYFGVPGLKNVTDFKFTDDSNVNMINAETVSDGKMYNVAGQRVDASYKGIVIMNGKKYMKK